MKVAYRALMACLVIAAASKAVGQDDVNSANRYYPGCKALAEARSDGNPIEQGICAGTLAALIGVSGVISAEFRWCPPSGITAAQAARVVVAGLEYKPQAMHEAFIPLALVILRDTWPCAP
jgi:hypothetical protein